MAGKGAVFIQILGDSTGLTAATTKAQASLAGLEGSTKSAGAATSTFGKLSNTVWLAAGAAVVGFAAVSVKAYERHELVLAQLQKTISVMPQLVGATTAEFQQQATALQNLTGVQDEEILAADTVLARFKLTAAQIHTVIPLVLDYARVTGQDASTAAGLLGKAFLGNAKALKTIGIQFTATGNTAKDFTTIVAALTAKVQGQAELYGRTLPGKIDIFKAKLNDIEEVAGKTLLPVLSGLTGALTKLLTVLAPIASKLPLILGALLGWKALTFLPGLLAGVSVGLERVAIALGSEAIAGGASAFAGLAVAIDASLGPIGLAAAALVAIGYGISKINTSALITAQRFHSIGNGAIGAGRVFQTNNKIITDNAAGYQLLAEKIQLAGSATADLSAGTSHLTGFFLDLARATGVTASTFQAQLTAAILGGQKTFQAFVNSTTQSFIKWRDGLATNLDGAESALSGLESKTNLTAAGVIKALQKTGQQQNTFRKEWTQGMNQAGERGKAFFTFIAQQGVKGLGILNAYTEGSKRQKRVILDSYNAQQHGAQNLATVIATKLVGSINTLNGILKAIAKKWGIVVNLTGDAPHQLAVINNTLDNMNGRQVSVYIRTHRTSFAKGGVAPGGTALVGEQGPELVDLPRGARVYTASQTRGMMNGGGGLGGGMTVNVYVGGSVTSERNLAECIRQELIKVGKRNGGRTGL